MERQLRIFIARALALALAFAPMLASSTAPAFADDFGPRGDVRELRFDAQRLLAQRSRAAGVDPQYIAITDIVSVGNAAIASARYGAHHEVLGFIRSVARWWLAMDAPLGTSCWNATTSYPLAPAAFSGAGEITPSDLERFGFPPALVTQSSHNADMASGGAAVAVTVTRVNGRTAQCAAHQTEPPDVQPVLPLGGELSSPPSQTSGYSIRVRYAANDARDASFRKLYGRTPTAAEFLPYPTTWHFVSTAVAYFDLTLEGSSHVSFAPGTAVNVWFPFVLDDTLRYDLTLSLAEQPIGPIYAQPFDNVLSYRLPGFSVQPGTTLMGEIDGNWR